MVAFQKAVIVALCAMLVAGLGAAVFFDQYYYVNLPSDPDQKVGRVHQLTVNHGAVRYGTQEEVNRFRLAKTYALIGLVCGGIAAILNVNYRVFAPTFSSPDS